MRSLFALFVLFALVLTSAKTALAYTPPPMTAHVTDPGHKLTEPQRIALDRTLEDYRLRTTNQIAVFVPTSLDGESIEDVGIETGRAWRIGVKGQDSGVLLIVAPVERRVRIEVGKGMEGALTDLQSNDIIQKMKPWIAAGHEDWNAGLKVGTDGIMAALDAGGAGGSPTGKRKGAPASGGAALIGIIFLLLVFLVPIILFIVIIRAITGAFSSHGQSGNRGWASGGTWSNDSSWSSSSSDSGWSGGGGGGGDSGFTGGGGDFGGGGSSDSF
jgi:uncharacterized protein